MWIPRSVPWHDWEEWIYVKNSLYSNDKHLVLKALDVVELWRGRGKIPHACDSSAQLVQITLHDTVIAAVETTSVSSSRSDYELRNLYAMGVIRGINGLVDPSQQGIFADSIYTIASKIGLPGWIVELRHDATHQSLPSLNVLRSGCQQLLSWYNTNYWDEQLEYLKSLSTISLPTLSSTTLISTGLQDLISSSGPILISEIFLPLFVEAAIMGSTTHTDKILSKAHSKKEFAKQYELWFPVLKCYLVRFGSTAFSALLVKIYSNLLDTIDGKCKGVRYNDISVTWLSASTCYWLHRLKSLIVKSDTHFMDIAILDESRCILEALVLRSESMLHKNASVQGTTATYYEEITSTNDIIQSIITGTDNSIWVASSKRLQQQQHVQYCKKWRLLSQDCASSSRTWPMGMTPGLINNELYLLEPLP